MGSPGHGFPEPHHFNVRLLAERVPVQTLREAFNDRHCRPGYLRGSFVLHYSVTPNDERVRRATADLAGWAEIFESSRPVKPTDPLISPGRPAARPPRVAVLSLADENMAAIRAGSDLRGRESINLIKSQGFVGFL